MRVEIDSGYIDYSYNKDFIVINELFIKPKRRCSGEGKFLLEYVKGIAHREKKRVELEVCPLDTEIDYPRLKEFYKKSGFKIIKEDFKDGCRMEFNYEL